MSDLEAFLAMCNRAGIKYKPHSGAPAGWNQVGRAATEIELEAGDGPANYGYGGFVAIFGFDEDGALLWMGAWE